MPRELTRYYVYWRIFYSLAAISHGLALINFANREVWFMMYFNVYSVIAFAICLYLLRIGRYRTAYWIAVTELVGHAVSATLCVGPEFGALGATMVILILVFVQPFYSLRLSLFLAGGILLIAAATQYYALTHLPFYPDATASAFDRTLQVVLWPVFALTMVVPFIRAAARAEQELEAAYGESERLLLNILPKSIAARLKSSGDMIVDDQDRVPILFADIVGFTSMSGRLQPDEVVTLLNAVFGAIDQLVAKYGVEKIKTIGDAYMVVAGVPDAIDDPDGTMARLALEIRSTVSRFKEPGTENPVRLRIGINSGKVVAGVIGHRKFAYDLWGDAVNVASRMESTGEAGKIQVTEAFAAPLQDRFVFEPRGEIEIKGKGRVPTSFLVAERSA